MILVGIIILSSIRVVLRGVTRVRIIFFFSLSFLFEQAEPWGGLFFSLGTQSIKQDSGRVTHARRTRSDNGERFPASIA